MALKSGKRVRRRSWRDDAWLCFVQGVLVVTVATEEQRRYLPQAVDLSCGAYLLLHSAQGVWSPGWVPSQSDLLAEDYEVLEEAA